MNVILSMQRAKRVLTLIVTKHRPYYRGPFWKRYFLLIRHSWRTFQEGNFDCEIVKAHLRHNINKGHQKYSRPYYTGSHLGYIIKVMYSTIQTLFYITHVRIFISNNLIEHYIANKSNQNLSKTVQWSLACRSYALVYPLRIAILQNTPVNLH